MFRADRCPVYLDGSLIGEGHGCGEIRSPVPRQCDGIGSGGFGVGSQFAADVRHDDSRPGRGAFVAVRRDDLLRIRHLQRHGEQHAAVFQHDDARRAPGIAVIVFDHGALIGNFTVRGQSLDIGADLVLVFLRFGKISHRADLVSDHIIVAGDKVTLNTRGEEVIPCSGFSRRAARFVFPNGFAVYNHDGRALFSFGQLNRIGIGSDLRKVIALDREHVIFNGVGVRIQRFAVYLDGRGGGKLHFRDKIFLPVPGSRDRLIDRGNQEIGNGLFFQVIDHQIVEYDASGETERHLEHARQCGKRERNIHAAVRVLIDARLSVGERAVVRLDSAVVCDFAQGVRDLEERSQLVIVLIGLGKVPRKHFDAEGDHIVIPVDEGDPARRFQEGVPVVLRGGAVAVIRVISAQRVLSGDDGAVLRGLHIEIIPLLVSAALRV